MSLRLKTTGQRSTFFLRNVQPATPKDGAGEGFAQRAKLAYVGAVSGHGQNIYADERSQVVVTHKAARRSVVVAA